MLPSITPGVPKDFGTPPEITEGTPEGEATPGAPGSRCLAPSPQPSPQIRFAPPQLELVSPQPHPIKAPGGAPPQPQIKALTVGMGTSPETLPCLSFPSGDRGTPEAALTFPLGLAFLNTLQKKKQRGRGVRGARGWGGGHGAELPAPASVSPLGWKGLDPAMALAAGSWQPRSWQPEVFPT